MTEFCWPGGRIVAELYETVYSVESPGASVARSFSLFEDHSSPEVVSCEDLNFSGYGEAKTAIGSIRIGEFVFVRK